MRTSGDEIDLTLDARLEQGGDGLLERIAVTLASTLDLKEVLRRLAGMVQETTSARRCSIVLIEDNRLRPAVAIGEQPDTELWSAFRHIAPIELRPEHWALLRDGRAAVFEDARSSPYIPAAWAETFDLHTVAAVPLVAHGEPIGVMAVDWPEPRSVSQAEVSTLEAIATYASLAVRNARLHEDVATRSQTMERLVEVASTLNSSSSLGEILSLVCASFEQVLGTIHCSVNLTDLADPLRLHTLATRGEPWFERPSGDMSSVVPEELGPTDLAWGSSSGPVVYPSVGTEDDGIRAPAGVKSAALFPLFGADGLMGLVVAGFPSPGGPGGQEVEVGQTLAEMAAAAVSRADLHDDLRRRVRQLELLSRLSEVIGGQAVFEELIGEVTDGLAADLGMSLDGIVVVDDDLRRSLGGASPSAHELAVLADWRATLDGDAGPLRLRRGEGHVLVPVANGAEVLGALRVSVGEPVVGIPDEEFLLTIGGACAEVMHRAVVARSIAENERRVAVASERDRMARDVHDSAGQLITTMGMKVAGYIADAPNDRWRHRLTTLLRIAQEADQQLRDAVHALAFLDVRRDGLVTSVRELAGRFGATTGVAVSVDVSGRPMALVPDHEDALFRVVHEALSNVERHADAASVTVTFAYEPDEVRVVVEDDGVGIDDDNCGPENPRFGLRGVQRRLCDLGGTLIVRGRRPHGTVVDASLPVDPDPVGIVPAEGV